jgi:hypothetical protein
METYKVKVLRCDLIVDNYDDYYTRSVFYPVAGDWQEVTAEEREQIREAIRYANRKTNASYVLIEYNENTVDEMFADAKDFMDKMRQAEKREQARREEEKRKREEKSQERKRKQLEKLKKELGEA